MNIPVVKSAEPANFPWAVQVQNTENWSTHGARVTEASARELASELKKSHPSLPVRIQHCTGGPVVTSMLPSYRKRIGDEVPYDTALWTNRADPPAWGSEVTVRLNKLGAGKVTGYYVVEGYLGVMVQLNDATRPDWHRRQNPENTPSVVFGAELAE